MAGTDADTAGQPAADLPLDVGRRIQREVGEAVRHMVGMAVGEINVYVDEVRGRERR